MGLNVSNLTLNAVEAQSFGEFIVERVREFPALNELHTLLPGVRTRQQIVLAGQYGKTGVADDGDGTSNCARPNSGAEASLNQIFTEPLPIGDTIEICQRDIDSKFKPYINNINTYRELFDIDGSDEQLFLANLLINTITPAFLRFAWLGDKSVAASGASTAGLKNATANSQFYNVIDGFWKQIFTKVTAGDVQRHTIAQNSQSTIANQLALTDGQSITIFEAMWANADSRLRSDPNAVIMVSFEIFDNYRKFLQSESRDFSLVETMNGIPALQWNGRTVYNMENLWDLYLKADFEDNTTNNAHYLPNRAVFTVPENLVITTLEEAGLSEIESFYHQLSRTNYSTYGFTEDAHVVEDYLISVAY